MLGSQANLGEEDLAPSVTCAGRTNARRLINEQEPDRRDLSTFLRGIVGIHEFIVKDLDELGLFKGISETQGRAQTILEDLEETLHPTVGLGTWSNCQCMTSIKQQCR